MAPNATTTSSSCAHDDECGGTITKIWNTSNPMDVFLERIVVVMVGLPARGKSYLSMGILRYLNFLGCPTQLFNAGTVRREMNLAGAEAQFFDTSNETAKSLRDEIAMQCLDQCLSFVSDHGPTGCRVAILDATNTTRERRQKVLERCAQHAATKDPSVTVLFLETIVDEDELLELNYRMKLTNYDYQDKDPEQSLKDFRQRVAKYEAVYEPISDEEALQHDYRYIQIFNAGQKLVSSAVEGYVARKIRRLMGLVHLRPRTIWLVLTGETENCLKGILGGDPNLSPAGIEYAQAVADVIHEREKCVVQEDVKQKDGQELPLTVYTGTLRAYRAMAEHVIDGATAETHLLNLGYANAICTGLLDSKSEAELEAQYPDEQAARRADKLNYRYPGVGGESYVDVVGRVHELTCLLEQSRGNSVVICDRAVYRCINGYFMGSTIEEIPHLEVRQVVLELRRNEKGFTGTHFPVTRGKCTYSSGAGTNGSLSK